MFLTTFQLRGTTIAAPLAVCSTLELWMTAPSAPIVRAVCNGRSGGAHTAS